MKKFGASSKSHKIYSLVQSIQSRLRLYVTYCRHAILSALVISSTGCIGIAFDRTTTVSIEKPIPLGHPSWPFDGFDRWACQPDPAQAYRTKSDFIASWGEPLSKEFSTDKETWIYAESGRWCGVWIALIVPIPLMLPVCETYDKITFENDLAVRATSQRFVVTATGTTLLGPMGIPIPIPYNLRAGKVTENDSSIGTFPPSKSDFSCVWRPPRGASTIDEALELPIPDTVNCFSDGKRQWVERLQCD